MDVLIINAYISQETNYFQIGTAILESVLKKHNIPVEIIDFNYLTNTGEIDIALLYNMEYAKLAKLLLLKQPKIVCFSTMANSYHISILLAKELKRLDNNIKIVFGGPQASLTYEYTLTNFKWIDVICIGESDKYFYNLIVSLLNNNTIIDIPSISYRANGEIITNSTDNALIDMNEIPFIDYRAIKNIESIKYFPIEGGRGCPFKCKYCSSKIFWKNKFRFASLDRMLTDIRTLNEKHNIKKFSFVHDLFTANRKKIIEFCTKIIKNEIDIRWACSSRVDTLDAELIKIMTRAGCERIFLGLESGSPRMQRIISKNLDIKKIIPIVKLLKNHNVDIVTSFIYGFPEETEEDLLLTVQLIKELLEHDVRDIQLRKLSILPGTEYYYEYYNMLEYKGISYISDISEGGLPRRLDNFITSNKEIFTSFYVVNSKTTNIYPHLGKFLRFILLFMNDYYPITLNMLLNKNNIDILILYKYFEEEINKNIDYLMDYIDKKFDNIYFIKKLISIIFNIISTEIKYILIKEVCKFENDMLLFSLNDIDEYVYEYKYNILEIKKKYPIQIKVEKKRTKLIFTRKTNNTINIIEKEASI